MKPSIKAQSGLSYARTDQTSGAMSLPLAARMRDALGVRVLAPKDVPVYFGPMFAMYATAALRIVIRETRGRRGGGRRVSRGRAFVVLLLPLALAILSVSLLFARAQ